MSDQDHKDIDDVTGVESTGHEWDGIKELNNPLPRWWLWTFYLTIVWAVGYTIAYPAWPLINGATTGLLGYSTRANVVAEIEAANAANAEVSAELAAADLTEVVPGTPVHGYAISGGAAVFRAHCSQCHGSGAAGAVGYPNLLDNDWLWGGAVEEVEYTIRHGIRNETDNDAHWSQMPAFGELLEEGEILSAVHYVRSMSGLPHEAELAQLGAEVYEYNCASCHGEEGMGDIYQGAPALNDQIWLYGGDVDTLVQTVTYSRFGVMPAMGQRLSEAEVKAVALYVHQLGGGE